ncbi:MAG: peptide deformylase [Myxococcota bacterium]
MSIQTSLCPNRCIKTPYGIVDVGSPVLRRRAVEVDPAELDLPIFRGLVAELVRRLAVGVGVAAPQVGFGVRVIVVEDGPEKWERAKPPPAETQLRERERAALPRMVLVNPVLTPLGEERTDFLEGCLSVGDLAAVVTRYRSVHLRALGLDGKVVEGDYHGWSARILQHEVDHLDGVLFVDRMDPRTLARHAALAELWPGASVAELREGLNTPGMGRPI